MSRSLVLLVLAALLCEARAAPQATLPTDDEDVVTPVKEPEGAAADCVCVPMSQCSEEYKPKTGGPSEVGWRSEINPCGKIDVCCAKLKEEGGDQHHTASSASLSRHPYLFTYLVSSLAVLLLRNRAVVPSIR